MELSKQSVNDLSVSDMFLAKGDMPLDHVPSTEITLDHHSVHVEVTNITTQIIGLEGQKLNLHVPSESIIEPVSPVEVMLEENALSLMPHEETAEKPTSTDDHNDSQVQSTLSENNSSDPSMPNEIIATNVLVTDINHMEPHCEFLLHTDPSEAPGPPDKVTLDPSALLKGTSEEAICEKKQTQASTSIPPKDVRCSKEEKNVRKNIPPKKDRMDPLKIDMSKSTVIPLTSSQLSLQCLECHIIFSDNKSKERHLKMNHPTEYEQCMLGDALFACYVCDRHFTCSTELMAHQRAHTEKQPFKCPICGEAFSRSSELTSHKKVHFGKHGYTCSDCGKPCKTLTLLKYHQRIHTGDRPYVCIHKECGKRFSMPKALQKHLEAHEKEDPEGTGDPSNATTSTKKKRNKGPYARKFSCSQCDESFKTAKSQLHHIKSKHPQCKTITPSSTAVASQELKGIPPVTTQSAIVQPPLLRMEAVGPAPQQIGPLGAEQIKRLIEKLGNVQKVNQLVILGVDPVSFQAQHLGMQQPQGLLQPLHFNFTQPTIQPDVPQQTEGDSSQEEMMSAGTEQNTWKDSLEIGVSVEQEETAVQGEQTVVLSENIEKPVAVVESDMRKAQLNEDQFGLVSELTENSVLTPQEESSEQIHTTEEQHIQVALDIKTIETGDGSSLFSITNFESSQSQTTEENISKPTEIMLSEETITTVECLDKMSYEAESLIESAPQTGQISIVKFDNNQEFEAQLGQLAPKETSLVEESKPQTIQPSLNIVQHHQENSYLEQVPCFESDIQQSILAPGDQKILGVKDCLYAKNRLPTKKKRSKKQVSLKSQSMGSQDEGAVSTSKKTSPSGETNTASKTVQKKREKTKSKKLVVRFGPRENKEKSSKQKLLKISKTGLYRDRQDTESGQVPTLSQNDNAPHLKRKQRNQKRKKGRTSENLTGLKQDISIPKAIKMAEQAPRGKPQKRKLETTRDLVKKGKCAQDTQQNETPKPKKKKQAKIPVAVSPKKAKIKNAIENELGKEIQTLAKRKDTEQKSVSDISCRDQIKEQALLLLKGHKQPQLKVHKLDAKTTGFEQPLKHKSQTKEICRETTVVQTKGDTPNKSAPAARQKKKKAKIIGKESKECQMDSSDLQMSSVDSGLASAPSCTKPKVVRKRKSSTKIDQEIALSPPYSQLTIGCQDCGKKFSEVPALQEHMASMHSVSGIFQSNVSSDITNNPASSKSSEVIITNAVHSSNFEIQVSTDWDVETEMREIVLEDKDEHRLSFPALSPSPSFPVASTSVEQDAKESDRVCQEIRPGNLETLCEDSPEVGQPFTKVSSTEPDTWHFLVHKKKSGGKENIESVQLISVSEPQESADIKEELPSDVKVVMVEDQNEDDQDSTQVNSPLNETQEGSDQQENESVHTELNQSQLPIQNVNQASIQKTDSILTEQPEIKQEEEEILVHREENQTKASMTRSRRGRGGRGRGKRQLGKRNAAEKRPAKEMAINNNNKEECRVVFQLYSLTDDCEKKNEEKDKQIQATCSTTAYKQSEVEECPEDRVVLELESVTTCAVEVMKSEDVSLVQKSSEQVKDNNSSGMVLEHFHTAHESGEVKSADSQGRMRRQGNPQPETEGADVKIEAFPSTLAPREIQPSERDLLQGVQMFLLKAENNPNSNEPKVLQQTHRATYLKGKHISQSTEGIPSSSSAVPDSAGKQCIFYPVKEEEGEILVEPPLSEQVTEAPEERTGAGPELEECEEISVEGTQMEMHHNFYCGTEEGDLGTEHQNPQDLLEFLSQSSDTEEFDNFQSEPEAETLIMSCYRGIHTNGARKQQEISTNEESGRNSRNIDFPQTNHQRTTTKECWKPIDYFIQYFNWDTWKEIAVWTAQVSKLSKPVTAKEVAQIAGIHIAMGTLKFPSMKLYWEDLTRVALIADAMPASRFSELTVNLKLASPQRDPRQTNGHREEHYGQGSTTPLSASDEALTQVPAPRDESRTFTSSPLCRYQGAQNCKDTSVSKTDPLWKVQSIVKRVQEGCKALKRNGNHSVDQYPLPFQRHPTHLLHHTVMISVNGSVMDFNLGVNDCKREEVVAKMVSQEKNDNQGMVFLCKPELSTPSMLEHLLEVGVRSAGKVGGARGQVGDEFVTSDGKLKLFRCHHGFILSAATKERSRSTSLVSGFERAIKAANLNRDLRSLYRTPCTSSSASAWPQSVLWDLMDLALVNSWLQYKQDQNHDPEPLSLMAFRLEVSKALILSSSIDAQDSSPPYPPVPEHSAPNTTPGTSDAFEDSFPDATTRYDGLGHWPEQLAEGEEGRCRFGGCDQTSRVRCLKCCVFLCISRSHNCFLKFHSQGSA